MFIPDMGGNSQATDADGSNRSCHIRDTEEETVEKRFNRQAVYRKHIRARDTKELNSVSEGQEGLLFIQ